MRRTDSTDLGQPAGRNVLVGGAGSSESPSAAWRRGTLGYWIHPHCVRARPEDIEEVQKMVAAGVPENLTLASWI